MQNWAWKKSWEYFDILEEIHRKDAAVVLPHVVQTSACASVCNYIIQYNKNGIL